jgi:hypothetical protein
MALCESRRLPCHIRTASLRLARRLGLSTQRLPSLCPIHRVLGDSYADSEAEGHIFLACSRRACRMYTVSRGTGGVLPAGSDGRILAGEIQIKTPHYNPTPPLPHPARIRSRIMG